ncbi:hypothetical protein EDD16DRAFT_1565992 [Pisolithus croceorrhizus]|nr:hypothetical protein EDD16DRAFT_1565992 [Pisolithus croceorrhizus]
MRFTLLTLSVAPFVIAGVVVGVAANTVLLRTRAVLGLVAWQTGHMLGCANDPSLTRRTPVLSAEAGCNGLSMELVCSR